MATVSTVNGNVWANMWATAYALPMWRRTHVGRSCVLARRVQSWIYAYICISCDFCRYTNKRTRKLRRVEIDYIIESVCCHRKTTYNALLLSANFVGRVT